MEGGGERKGRREERGGRGEGSEERGEYAKSPTSCHFCQLGEVTKTTFFIQNNFRTYLTYHCGLHPMLLTINGTYIGQ